MTKAIPMLDLKQQYRTLTDEIQKGTNEMFESGIFILGPNVKTFDKDVADYLGVKYAVSVASGTDALHLALLAAGVKAGDEVITTPFTFIATVEAIFYLGAKPVFVDIDPDTFNLDLNQLEDAITDKTTAILPVHLFGQAMDMIALNKIAKKHDLKVIEDAAQSFGATFNGEQTGSFGDAGCFSFYPTKNLACYGDGGLITTNSKDIYEQLNILRNHGSKERYHHDIIGYNSRLDEQQAIVLRAKLKHIDTYNQNRRNIAKQYHEKLASLPVKLPTFKDDGSHVFHQYTLLSEQRDAIQKTLAEEKVSSGIYYPIPLHKQRVFSEEYHKQSFPVTERVAKQCLSLPIFPEMTDEQVSRVCEVFEKAFVTA